jgi:hypothetical protein
MSSAELCEGLYHSTPEPRAEPGGCRDRAIIGFMTWMWLSIIVVLVGAKLNAEIEHRTMRGAEMADTMGPS